jgi:hypothetical protein
MLLSRAIFINKLLLTICMAVTKAQLNKMFPHQWICPCKSTFYSKTEDDLLKQYCFRCKSRKCPECGKPMMFLEEDTEDMTEGQLSDYMNDIREKEWICRCGHQVYR